MSAKATKLVTQKPRQPEDLIPLGVPVQDSWRDFLHLRWNEIRTDVEDFDLLAFGRDNISAVLFDIPQLKPLLDRLLSPDCDPTDLGRVTQPAVERDGWQYIDLPKGYPMYKGMDSYVTPEEEARYFERQTEEVPYWLGDQLLATRYAALQNGGVHAYEAKQPIKLLVWNDRNLERIYRILCDFDQRTNGGPQGLYGNLRKMFQIGFGIDIDPYKRLKYIYPTDKYIPLSQVVYRGGFYCDHLDDSGLSYYYKKFYLHRLLFRWWILPLVEQLGMHGVYGPQHYNPLVGGGIWFQEFIVADYARYMHRAPDNPLDWCSYKGLLDFPMPDDGFIVTGNASAKNHDHRMIKWYLEQESLEGETTPLEKPEGSHRILSINVHNFRAIKENGNTPEMAVEGMLRMADSQGADLVVMCEVSFSHLDILKARMHQYGYWGLSRLPDNTTTLVMTRVAATFEPPVKISEGDHPEIRVPRWATCFQAWDVRFCATHLSIGVNPYIAANQPRVDEIRKLNSRWRIAELDNILKLKPDVIIGDLNFVPEDPEFRHLIKKGYVTQQVDSTTPFGTQVDYAWVRSGSTISKSYQINTLPYHWSDHKPIVLTFSNVEGGKTSGKQVSKLSTGSNAPRVITQSDHLRYKRHLLNELLRDNDEYLNIIDRTMINWLNGEPETFSDLKRELGEKAIRVPAAKIQKIIESETAPEPQRPNYYLVNRLRKRFTGVGWEDLELCALRYTAVGVDRGQQWALDNRIRDRLIEAGIRTEAFASPFNCRMPRWYSLYDDDCVFGSMGNFFQAPIGNLGALYLNPPFTPLILEHCVRKLEELPSTAKIVLITPDWHDARWYRALEAKYQCIKKNRVPYISDKVIRPMFTTVFWYRGIDPSILNPS